MFVKADLRACAEYIMLSAPVPSDMPLCSSDFSTIFQCHGKIQGREREINTMRDVLSRVAASKKSEVITLEGVPGSGKVLFFSPLLSP
jgi:hypothetical protein